VPVHGRWLPLATPCPMFLIFDHALFCAGPLYDKNPSHGWTQIIERYDWSDDNRTELAKGWIKTADTIAELASVVGLDAATLEDTIGWWNRYCETKHDVEFGRTLMMDPIAEAPFYAVELSPSMLNTQGGPTAHRFPGCTVQANWDLSIVICIRARETSGNAWHLAAFQVDMRLRKSLGNRPIHALQGVTQAMSIDMLTGDPVEKFGFDPDALRAKYLARHQDATRVEVDARG